MYWIAATAAAGFILTAIPLFLWRSSKPKAFIIKQLARVVIFDESVPYEVEDLVRKYKM